MGFSIEFSKFDLFSNSEMQRSESESDFMFLVENKVIDELKNQLRIKIVDNCYKILKKSNIINWDNFFYLLGFAFNHY